ncbi:MAG: DbpA RNA binding domain-containing protein, partial [Bacteriovoracaceae bacterium]
GVRATSGMQRFFINLGRMDGMTPGDLLKFVASTTNISGRDIGRIDTKEKFSFIEAPVHLIDSVLGLQGELYNNRRVSVELAESAGPRGGSGGGGFRGGRGGGGGFRGGPRSGGFGGDRGGRRFENSGARY